MGIFRRIVGFMVGSPLVADQLDDEAERMFARRIGLAAEIMAVALGLTFLVMAFRCG